MGAWDIIDIIVGIVLGLLMAYQFLYIIIGLFKKKKFKDTKTESTYGILIAGRNEELVIGQLLDSIKKQNYNLEKVKIFVVADNCDAGDKTAEIAREKGAVVYERHNKDEIGKGYALNFLLQNIAKDFPEYDPDGWFVFDADNILDKNYIYEMNKAFNFAGGGNVITSYRASKNYGKTLFSMGASVGFVRECRFLHTPRTVCNMSTHISGTGFLAPKEVLNPKLGWKYTCITEDLEFSCDNLTKGKKILYCDDAIFYDEQPETWKQTYRQRMRWQKGSYLCCKAFTFSFLLKLFKTLKFPFYDFLMFLAPFSILSSSWAIVNGFYAIIESFIKLLMGASFFQEMAFLLLALAQTFILLYLGMFAYGSIAVLKDWKRIKATKKEKILSMFAYPIFMICLIPICFLALFKKVEWKQIKHTNSVDIEDINKSAEKTK